MRTTKTDKIIVQFLEYSFSVLVFLQLIAFSVNAQEISENQYSNTDLIIVIDTSMSMIGAGANANDIFDDVINTCKELISDKLPVHGGNTITLISFANDVSTSPKIEIDSETQIERFFELLDSLVADGTRTFLSKALLAAINEASQLMEQTQTGRNRHAWIFTDGYNDPPADAPDYNAAIEEMATVMRGQLYVWIIQLGQGLEGLDEATEEALKPLEPSYTNNPNPIEVTKFITTLRPRPRRIRLTIQKQNESVTGSTIITLPEDLNSDHLEIELTLKDLDDTINLKSVFSEENSIVTITIEGFATDRVPNRRYSGSLTVKLIPTSGYHAEPVVIPLSVITSMFWPFWIKVMLWLICLAAVVVSGFKVLSWRKSTLLFGELEYWPMNNPQNRKTIQNLAIFGSSAEIGVNDIKITGATSSISTLVITKYKKRSIVTVQSSDDGALTFKEKARKELQLWDRDSFEIEGWGFRYKSAIGRPPRDLNR